MSNTSIMSVREMIENAFGETDVNTVNFKLIQAILYLLARQLRVLERQVGVEIGFVPRTEETERTLAVTEVNISATVPKKMKGKGVSLLNTVLASTPKITQSTIGGGGMSVFERMSRISRVSAYDVQTSRRRAEEMAGKGEKVERAENGERKSINESDTRKRRESSSKYTDDDSRSSKRGRSESEKDRYGDESDVSDQFEDSRQRSTGKSEKRDKDKQKDSGKEGVAGKGGAGGGSDKSGTGGTRGKGGAGGSGGASVKKGTKETDDVGGTEGVDGTGGTGRTRSKGGTGKQSSGRTRKTGKGISSSSSSDTYKMKKLQKALNNIEEERERVLRIIQQRTDSKVEDTETPTPIASMDSMEVQYEKLLILERVPSKEAKAKAKKDADQPRLSIVTQDQFDELVKQVELLEKKFGQASIAEYGENAKLMEELRKGASLTDAMAALQLSARIETAEKALKNMIALLTELSKRGPPKQGKLGAQGGKAGDLSQSEVAGAGKGKAGAQGQKGGVDQWQEDMGQDLEEGTDSEIDALTGHGKERGAGKGKARTETGVEFSDEEGERDSLTQLIYEGPDTESQGKPTSLKLSEKDKNKKGRIVPDLESIALSEISATAGSSQAKQDEQQAAEMKKYGNFITSEQLQTALKELYDEFSKTMHTVTGKSAFNAEHAMKICKAIENQLEKSGNIGDRMGNLELAVAEYIEQINILDTGLSSQMTNYQEQLTQMQHELEIGLENMAEALASQGGDSEAVTELNSRLSALQSDFDRSRSMQVELSDVQTGLGLDLEALWKQIEHLRGIKSDRDEVADALRDKAGIGILNGLVTLNQFDAVRGDLEKRIRSAYDKFNNQEIVWQKAIDDLTREINEKAEYAQVVALRDDVNKNLDMLRNRIENMLNLLGEPRTIDLAKTIYRDAPCLSCDTPSPFDLEEPNIAQLPPMKVRPPTIGEEAPSKRKGEGDHSACYFGQPIPHALDPRARVCTRYCGSIVPPSTKLQKEPVNININTLIRQPTIGIGPDGKPCGMDEKLLRVPCTPCNTSAMLNAVKTVQQAQQPAVTEDEDSKNTEVIANYSMQTAIGDISTSG